LNSFVFILNRHSANPYSFALCTVNKKRAQEEGKGGGKKVKEKERKRGGGKKIYSISHVEAIGGLARAQDHLIALFPRVGGVEYNIGRD
jgi:hypothetical protein